MATSEKNGRSGSFGSHNGHSTHAHGAHSGAASKSGAKRTRGRTNDTPQARIGHILDLGRELPRRFEGQLRSNPVGVLASVGAGAFVLGALLGSKIGRIALAAALPLAIQRVLEGALGEKIGEYAQELTGSVVDEADA